LGCLTSIKADEDQLCLLTTPLIFVLIPQSPTLSSESFFRRNTMHITSLLCFMILAFAAAAAVVEKRVATVMRREEDEGMYYLEPTEQTNRVPILIPSLICR
jgi:hypothetical protein